MTTFVDAVENQEARTTNGMKARKSTTDKVVDLFFKIGASRGKDIVPAFVKAYVDKFAVGAVIAFAIYILVEFITSGGHEDE